MRNLDIILFFCVAVLGIVATMQYFALKESRAYYQKNRNLSTNVTQCLNKAAEHDWKFWASGVDKFLQTNPPGETTLP